MAGMGEKEGLSLRLSAEDEAMFPQLAAAGYYVTSPRDPRYNCIAHASGDVTRKWDPSSVPAPGYYWPDGVRKDNHPDALRALFERQGYELCQGGDYEDGYEKIAIYVDNHGHWSHAAKQDGDRWISKLGNLEDICHRSPHCFGGSDYGTVIYFMRRRSGRERA